MSLELLEFQPTMATDWDAFCDQAVNATFLHTRRFLSYHGSRYTDASVVLVERGRWVGILPAATGSNDVGVVTSHPGSTYGGLVHKGWLTGSRTIEAMQALARHFAARGYRFLRYKPLPSIYPSLPAQDDLYALSRLDARRVRCELSSTIDLAARLPLSERRRRGLKKASAVVEVSAEPQRLAELWGIIEENLARKYNARPVHSLAEIAELRQRFPSSIGCLCAIGSNCVEAGILIFRTPRVWRAQYIAASPRGYEWSALDAVFDRALRDATSASARFFDFGTSNEDHGRVLNDGLYKFKSEFGGGGVVYETYDVDLSVWR